MSRSRPDDASLARIRMLVTDVDGVLTDGRLHFDIEGRELKSFHVHDGAGIVYWHRHGGLSGFLSGRGGHVVETRAKELGVHELHLGQLDKGPALDSILAAQDLAAEEIAYVGDDLLDLPVIERVGFAAAPADARPEVLERVHYVTTARGGQGVVREVVELLLRARGVWQTVVERGGRP